MAKDTEEITVGANGSVLVAPVGSTIPADVETPLGPEWLDLGYTSEDGVTIEDSKSLESIPVWQSFYPARRIVTERDFSARFTLRQFASRQVEFAFGGGTVDEVAPGLYRFTPPAPEILDERALAVEWQDGDKHYRLILPRGMVTENVESNIVRTGPMDLPITFGIVGQEGEDPWIFDTDDPAFDAGVGS